MADDTTQTTDPKDTDAPDEPGTGETTGEGERAGTSEADYHKRQALENKVKAEQLNSLMASYGVSSPEELKELLAQSPAAPVETRTEEDEEDYTVEDVLAVKQWATKGDATSILAVKLASRLEKLERQNERLTRGVGDAFTARDITDPAERAQAIALYQKHPKLFGNLNVALMAVQKPKLAAENVRLREELGKLKKLPDPDVLNAPKTAGQETAITQPKRKMTLAQAVAEAEKLRAVGKDHAAMLFLQAAEIEG